MMKQKHFLFYLLLISILFVRCSENEPEVILPPEISGIEAEYAFVESETLELSPTVANSNDAVYSWLLDGKEVAKTLKYTFSPSNSGTYNLIFKATNKGGTTQAKTIVTVIPKGLPPVITQTEDEYAMEEGAELKLTPTIVSDSDVTFSWIINDKEVGNTSEYTFTATKPEKLVITLKVSNRGGITEKKITITVTAKIRQVTTKTHTLLTLETPSYITANNNISWKVTKAPSGQYRLAYSNTPNPIFIASETGEYTVEMTAGEIKGDIIITVSSRDKKPSPFIANVFDYLPAPGQFVNKLPQYVQGDTHKDMVRKAGEWLIGEDAYMITLGGWGGYVTFGFDHTIVNVAGKRDFRIRGNAFGSNDNFRPNAPFGGSCEPGIIMVAYDKNKNGKPDDDEWYEIKGSSNFSAEKEPWYSIAKENGNDVRVFRDYEITYYRPTKETPDMSPDPEDLGAYVAIKDYIRWEDNKNNNGHKVKNIYHSQSYYPEWISQNQLTFKGIRLPENGINEYKFNPDINDVGMYFVLYGFRYGYVDNSPNVDENSAIDIDWAIDKDGNPANLPGIDFVKVYNGVNQENGWLGESSTEVERGEDLHLLKINIETIK